MNIMPFLWRSGGRNGLLWLCVACVSFAGHAAQLLSQRLSDDGSQLWLTTDAGQVQLTAIGQGTFSVTYFAPGEPAWPSFALAEQTPAGTGVLSATANGWRFALADIQAEIQRQPFAIRYYRDQQLLTAEAPGVMAPALMDNPSGGESWQDKTGIGFGFSLAANERLLGGGQRVMGMDRRGARLPLYNKASYGYGTQAQQMYYGLPAVMSDKHYVLAFDNAAAGWLDLGATDADRLLFSAIGGRRSYVISSGHDYPQLLANFTAAVGRQPLPPRWALGNYASRFGYRSEAQTRETVAAFAEQGFPLDAVVLDLYWFGADIKGHMGNLDWDRQAWPTAEQMIADFAEQGIKTILITEPFVLSSSQRWQEANRAQALTQNLDGSTNTFDFYFGHSGLIDVFSDQGQRWFADIYQRLQQQGVAGWWGDLGEPEAHPDGAIHRLSRQELRASGAEVHNAYGHQWAQLLYQSLQQWQPQQRPMIMMRSGFIGSQRYGMIPWTGDVARSWQGLQPQVELSLQMGMLGLGFTHSDLGGFAGGETLDSELYTRWLQYGAFQPIFRPHGQDHLPVEPIFTDAITQARVKRFITLRYQLMPYLYSMVYQNSLTGMPLMRPLFMEEPQRFEQTDAYRFGDAFIVVPITTAGISEVSVDLPAGIYFDWFSGQRYQGGQTVTIPVDLDTIPLLVEAGAFVPMVKPYRNEQAYSSRALTVHYFHDEQQRQGHGIMYEDDGQDPLAIEANRYERLQFSSHYEPSQRHLSLRLERQGAYPNMPARRQLTLQLHHLGAVAKIEAAGQPLAWEQRPNGVEIEVEWGGAPLNIEVTLQDVLAQQTRL